MDLDHEALGAIARRYERFATVEARGSSPLYERFALRVAGSSELLMFLAALPAERQQPNLLFAAIRHLYGVPKDENQLWEFMRLEGARIRKVMLSRTTQTNEPARCAVLLPALAMLGTPLAVIEVGASAGLCLLGDHYGYDYGRQHIPARHGIAVPAPTFPCRASVSTPLPLSYPDIVWRAGLDVNPLDVHSAAEMAWLETLVWPGQDDRAQRLRAAIEIAKLQPPKVHRGNLLTDLSALAGTAPKDAQLVVFHTAVLAYVEAQADRDAFAEIVRRIGAVWISNEAPSVFPDIAARAPAPPPGPGHFLLAVNGEPVAWTGPHGQSIDWLKGTAEP